MTDSGREIINNLEQYHYYMAYFNYVCVIHLMMLSTARLHCIINNLDLSNNGRKFCAYVEELFECLSTIYQDSGNFYARDVMDS
jgi:hypothetical protein